LTPAIHSDGGIGRGIMARSLAAGNLRATASVVALVAVATLLFPGRAAAAAPVIGTVGTDNGYAGATWSLPAGVQAEFYEVGSDPATSTFGNFLQRNLLRFGTLDGDQRCVIDDGPPLSQGVYYIHVAGHDTRPDQPQIEFSATKRIVVVGASSTFSCSAGGGGGSGGGGGEDGGTVVVDKDKPSCSLRFKRRQDIDRLHIRARMNEAGLLSASAVVVVGRKPMAFKLSSRTAKQNRFTRLSLKPRKRKDLRRLKRSLRRGKRLRVRVLVTARDKAGNERNRRVTILPRP
jgi:hypothetical protein